MLLHQRLPTYRSLVVSNRLLHCVNAGHSISRERDSRGWPCLSRLRCACHATATDVDASNVRHLPSVSSTVDVAAGIMAFHVLPLGIAQVVLCSRCLGLAVLYPLLLRIELPERTCCCCLTRSSVCPTYSTSPVLLLTCLYTPGESGMAIPNLIDRLLHTTPGNRRLVAARHACTSQLANKLQRAPTSPVTISCACCFSASSGDLPVSISASALSLAAPKLTEVQALPIVPRDTTTTVTILRRWSVMSFLISVDTSLQPCTSMALPPS